MSIIHEESTYRYIPENNDPMTYHGILCPKCFMENKYVTLYLRDTKKGENK